MFLDSTPTAELRLIDFGSGFLGDPMDSQLHTTFAGSAFYISPKMFQHTYTYKTDVWSVGVTLYVLVAGHPRDRLQEAFDTMQTHQNRDLRSLPNLPQEMPGDFFDMLEQALTFRHNSRPSAGDLLKSEFAQFHLGNKDSDTGTSGQAGTLASHSVSARRSPSISLKGSIRRHSIALGWKEYERSLTTLLSQKLSRPEMDKLVEILKDRVESKRKTEIEESLLLEDASQLTEDMDAHVQPSRARQLYVIQVQDLKSVITNDLMNQQVYALLRSILFCFLFVLHSCI